MLATFLRYPVLSLAVIGIAAINLADTPLSHAVDRALTSEVLGPDTNASGLRDDVEAWIHGLYPDAAHPIRIAAEELSKAYQLGMQAFHENSPQLRQNALQAYGVAHACLTEHFSPEAAYKILSGVEKAMGNSAERAQYVVALKAQHARIMHSADTAYQCLY